LPQEEYKRLLPNLELVSLNFKQIIYKPDEPIEYVYFPNRGVISLVNVTEDGRTVEAGMVGNEGMAGIPLFLGADKMPGLAISQVVGDAVRMKADIFKREVTPATSLYKLLLRYTQALLNQISQSVACNSLHPVEGRCCRWLLMCHDRVRSDQFMLTQELLSQMLGVRRASVSVVAATLQNAGLIRYRRGKITILDREGLEAGSCECYRVVKQEFDRLLGTGE
ncbi:MAG: Crp/Fnr family transcriptional regulator, partial [Coleofasciculus sp. Co-bin14]|nr:Crp/Fnr family transcriptional regulator [Coleofasciculus sp. Co-bin14]